MKIMRSRSDQNVYFTYVCLINNIKPCDTVQNKESNQSNTMLIDCNEEINKDEPIKIERTKALHELIDFDKEKIDDEEIIEGEASASHFTEVSDITELEDRPNFILYDNPRVLKLTKMKWLTEEREDVPDSRSPSLSPSNSTTSSSTSNYSAMSEENLSDIDDKYLSTIIQLDKEYNMFGLSQISILGIKSKRKRTRSVENRPAFPQTAIVQFCCSKACCRYKSNTDLPSSLKCGGCKTCCVGTCIRKPCPPPPICVSCPPDPCATCSCKCPGPPGPCSPDCSVFGLTVRVKRRAKFDPPLPQLTPRNSSVLQKPLAARHCTHSPCCVPPSNCFPYLMPCFWPASPGAPCSEPAQCFHKPPCPAPRKRQRVPIPPQYKCLKHCTAEGKVCPNETCPGKIPAMKSAIEAFATNANKPKPVDTPKDANKPKEANKSKENLKAK